MSTAANPDVYAWRWFPNSADVNSPGTPLAALNTSYEVPQASLDSPLYLYIGVENDGDMNFVTGGTLQYEDPNNPGTWNDVTSSSSFVRIADGLATDGDAITASQVGAGFGSFNNGEYDDASGAVTSNLTTGHINYAFSVQFLSADLSGGETVNLRLIETGGAAMTNDSGATISATIEEGSASVTADPTSQAQASADASLTEHASITASDTSQAQASEDATATSAASVRLQIRRVIFRRRRPIRLREIRTSLPSSDSLLADATSQAQASEQASLTEHAALTADDTSQAQISETADVTEDGELTPDDTAQAQASEIAAVTQHHSLTAADSSQSQVSQDATIPQEQTGGRIRLRRVLFRRRRLISQRSGATVWLPSAAQLAAFDTRQTQASQDAGLTEHTSVTASATSQSQTSEAADLVVEITADATSQAQASDTASLTEHASIAAQATSQAQVAETADVSEQGTLTPDATAQSQASDDAGITEHASLTANASSQSQSSDQADLTEHASITVSDTAQSQVSADADALEQGTLAPSATAQAQVSADAEITEHASITADDTAQTQASESPQAIQNHLLGVIATSQAQTSADVGITEHAILTPDPTSQTQFSDDSDVSLPGGMAALVALTGKGSAQVALTGKGSAGTALTGKSSASSGHVISGVTGKADET